MEHCGGFRWTFGLFFGFHEQNSDMGEGVSHPSGIEIVIFHNLLDVEDLRKNRTLHATVQKSTSHNLRIFEQLVLVKP